MIFRILSIATTLPPIEWSRFLDEAFKETTYLSIYVAASLDKKLTFYCESSKDLSKYNGLLAPFTLAPEAVLFVPKPTAHAVGLLSASLSEIIKEHDNSRTVGRFMFARFGIYSFARTLPRFTQLYLQTNTGVLCSHTFCPLPVDSFLSLNMADFPDFSLTSSSGDPKQTIVTPAQSKVAIDPQFRDSHLEEVGSTINQRTSRPS